MKMARQKLASGNRLFTESPRYTSLRDIPPASQCFLRCFSDATLPLMAALYGSLLQPDARFAVNPADAFRIETRCTGTGAHTREHCRKLLSSHSASRGCPCSAGGSRPVVADATSGRLFRH